MLEVDLQRTGASLQVDGSSQVGEDAAGSDTGASALRVPSGTVAHFFGPVYFPATPEPMLPGDTWEDTAAQSVVWRFMTRIAQEIHYTLAVDAERPTEIHALIGLVTKAAQLSDRIFNSSMQIMLVNAATWLPRAGREAYFEDLGTRIASCEISLMDAMWEIYDLAEARLSRYYGRLATLDEPDEARLDFLKGASQLLETSMDNLEERHKERHSHGE